MGIPLEEIGGGEAKEQGWRETYFIYCVPYITFWILYRVHDLHIQKINTS